MICVLCVLKFLCFIELLSGISGALMTHTRCCFAKLSVQAFCTLKGRSSDLHGCMVRIEEYDIIYRVVYSHTCTCLLYAQLFSEMFGAYGGRHVIIQ